MLFLKGFSRKRLILEKLAPGKLRPGTLRELERGVRKSKSRSQTVGNLLLGKVRAEKDKFWKIPLRRQGTQTG